MEVYPSNSQADSANSVQNDYSRNSVLIRPCIVGYMSVDGSRSYHPDLSQLKFIRIPKEKLRWDLNHNIEKAVKRTTDDNNEKLDILLHFLLDQDSRLCIPHNIFISYRRTLINVMYKSFHLSEPVGIRACLYKNNIYLYDIESEQDIKSKQCRTDQEKKFCAWGYKFEQYISSDAPTHAPNIEQPVVENEEFSLCYFSQIGNHRLFYGAQIDGLLTTSSTTPPPLTTDVQEIINYLRYHQFIELKTSREIQNTKQEKNFKKYKLLRCWCQCYLADLKGLLVGFRNDHGTVNRVQWFNTVDIPKYCRNEWDPQALLNYLNYFLSYVKHSLYSYTQGNSTYDPVTLDVFIDAERKIRVEVQTDKNEAILPEWYIQALNK